MAAKKDKQAKRKAEAEQQPPQQAAATPDGKKKKRRAEAAAANDTPQQQQQQQQQHPNGRRCTVSMAVPGSIIDNTQSFEMANFVAGQVARTAAVFNVDELIIIDDTPQRKDGTVGAGAAFLARVCQYLETPQYLRKALIPMHPDLRLAVSAVLWFGGFLRGDQSFAAAIEPLAQLPSC